MLILDGDDDSCGEDEGDEAVAPPQGSVLANNDDSNITPSETPEAAALTTAPSGISDHKYDSVGYGCVRSEFVAHGVKMIRVEIEEPKYYGQFRDHCEQQWRNNQEVVAAPRSAAAAEEAEEAPSQQDGSVKSDSVM